MFRSATACTPLVTIRFVRGRKASVCERLLAAFSKVYEGELVMIDSSFSQVHQHGATLNKGTQITAWDMPAAV